MVGNFNVGRIVTTASIAAKVEPERVMYWLIRHRNGDFGQLCDEDIAVNNEAIQHGGRVLSRYEHDGQPVYVITEPVGPDLGGYTPVTTVLYATEY